MMQTTNFFGLSEEQMMIRENVLELLERVMPREKIKELDKAGEFPFEAYQALADAGWMGLAYPEEFGGAGGSNKDLAVLIEAMAYHYGGIATAYNTTIVYAGMHICRHASKEVREELMPKIIDGSAKLALGLTEPGAGSDAASIQTKAVRDGDEFVINGQKLYTTCAHVADYLIVVTKTRPGSGHKGMTIFLVDAKQPGVTIRPLDMLGRHTTHANEVFLDNVRTPASWMIGEENEGWKNLMDCLNVERMCIAAVGAGNTFKILDYTLDYAKQREQFGRSIGKFQVIQHKFADMRMKAETNRLFLYRVADLLDNGQNAVMETSMAKVVATENNFEVANMGLQIFGGAGYTTAYDIEMMLRDARIGPIGAGTSEIQRNIIAKLMEL
ncbi:acyl-CoA dehydrogenase family protein [Sneathiella sp.]|uniref:acyl-CoA dehydrogenase family protein n=1 Tax=Sneathiella sp. TaxID=1964365 RepID=UPI0025F28560|nr:acyl-CoA dehydrogenase family protein [Sneathiella sp.]|tara:strand:- start:26712 stop:27866 length:1155 start_codon:yes stop_codon:yes gene_type:complete